MKNILFILFLAGTVCFFSCKKDSVITSGNASVNISADSIKFDTVFTTAGSVTKSFKIFNDNNQKLRLSKVKLMGGSNSAFKLNINGNPAVEENDIEIAANDSIYVFVSVYVNPTSASLPFIISDSVLINYNGNDRFVQLEAYGQNAHFLNNEIIGTNTTWTNDLPYVILGSLTVDTSITLRIEAGCKIYAHANAPILVDGTLIVQGEKNNEVQFRGDRLDEYYNDLPASWPGIYFGGSSLDNEIHFAIIKNANQAVVAEGPATNGNTKLVIHQTVIDNAFEAGLFGFNSSIDVDNTLITNCGNNLIIQYGGNYRFSNCTVACYSNQYLLHTNPVLQVSDATVQNGATSTADLTANFTNCIFWGESGAVDDEVLVDKVGSGIFNVNLENCLYKALNDPPNTTLSSVITNEDPSFDSVDVSNKYYDFRITKNPLAPGIDNGTIVAFPFDLDDTERTVGIVDIGCYEKH